MDARCSTPCACTSEPRQLWSGLAAGESGNSKQSRYQKEGRRRLGHEIGPNFAAVKIRRIVNIRVCPEAVEASDERRFRAGCRAAVRGNKRSIVSCGKCQIEGVRIRAAEGRREAAERNRNNRVCSRSCTAVDVPGAGDVGETCEAQVYGQSITE